MAKFGSISAPKLPKMACIGTIANVADTKASSSGSYNVTNISIEPRGGGYKSQFALLTRPEWMAPAFNPDIALDGNDGAKFVYRTNIQNYSNAGPSRLLGLAGSEEASEKLVDDIFSSVVTQKDPESGEEVSFIPDEKLTAVIRKYANAATIGYVLVQKMEDTGEVDEDGKKIKLRTPNYELGELFFPTEKALTKYRKLAKDRPEDWRVAFDEAF